VNSRREIVLRKIFALVLSLSLAVGQASQDASSSKECALFHVSFFLCSPWLRCGDRKCQTQNIKGSLIEKAK
jgi:hypothetical protein